MFPNQNPGGGRSSVKVNEFHPIIVRKADAYCVYLPEWNVSGVGSTLDEAYLQFQRNLESVEAHAAEFGLAALTPEPYPSLKKGVVLRELTLFFTKVAATAFIVILLFVLLLPNIAASLRHNLKEMLPKEIVPVELKDPRYWALKFPAQMNERLDRLKPEEVEQMRTEWSRLLGRTVPVVSPSNCRPQQKENTPRQ